MTNAIVLRYKDRALLFFLHSLLSRNVNRPRSFDRGHNGRGDTSPDTKRHKEGRLIQWSNELEADWST